MSLKFVLDSLDEAVAGTEGHYLEGEDGKFILDLEGGPKDQSGDVEKLDRSVKAARQDVKDIKSKYAWVGELTEAEVQELRDAREDLQYQLENNKAPSNEELEERAQRLADRRTREIETKLSSTTEELTNYKQALVLHEAAANQRKIRDAVDSVLNESNGFKIHDSAKEDIYPYAERIMEIDEDGNVRSKEGVGIDPGLSFKDILGDLQNSGRRSHWFQGSTGGGLDGRAGGDTYSGPNPFDKKSGTFNLTQIGQLKKSDPKRAMALCKKAGEKPSAYGLVEVA